MINNIILSLDFLSNIGASIIKGIVEVLIRVVKANNKTPKTDGQQREEKLQK